MAEWLVLRLARSQEERVSWMRADARGQPLGAPQFGSLRQAASAASGRRVAVVVPSSDVLIATVDLPVKGGVRLQQVVAYALEEQLAADIETLHFALGARDERSGHTSVAVVTRALMERWLGAVNAAGITPEILCSEAALLPHNPGHVVVMLEADTLWVQRTDQPPLALPALEIATAIMASLGEQMASDNLIFYVSPEDWHRRSAEVEALRNHCASLKVQLLNFGPLPLLAPQLAAGELPNLLTADFAPKSTLGAGWRQWRLAATLAAALFALHVGGLALQRHQQQRTERALDDAIGQIARDALPGDSGTGSVRSRVEQRLLAAQSGATGSGFIPALAALAEAVQDAPGTSIQALSFHDNALDLKLQSTDAEKLEHIDQSLRGNGWQAELTSGSAVGSAYAGQIQARGPGAARAAP